MGAPEKFDIDADQKMRLAVASRIAAGMMANPETFKMRSWQAETAQASLAVADQLIRLVRGG